MATATYNPTKDAQIEGVFDDTANYGFSTTMSLGVTDSGGGKAFLWRDLLEFDVSSLGSVTVSSAKLTLRCGGAAASAAGAKIHRIIRSDWSESQVTWLIYKTSNNWTTAGAASDGNDYDASTPTPVSWNLPTSAGSFDITGLGSFVQDAIDSRSGLVRMRLSLDDENPGSTINITVDTKEHGTPGNRPVLEVVHPVAPRRRSNVSVMSY